MFIPTCQIDFSEIEIRHPKFSGYGHLALPTLRNAHQEFKINLEFRPDSLSGLLLYSGEMTDLRTDFFSLYLDSGHLVFRFDCGTGPAELWTDNRVTLSEWNTCQVWRRGNVGGVRLNNYSEAKGTTKGEYSRITFRLPLYLGGSPDLSVVSDRVGTIFSFSGCIESMAINNHQYNFKVKGMHAFR